MKNFRVMLLALMVVVLLCGCGNRNDAQTDGSAQTHVDPLATDPLADFSAEPETGATTVTVPVIDDEEDENISEDNENDLDLSDLVDDDNTDDLDDDSDTDDDSAEDDDKPETPVAPVTNVKIADYVLEEYSNESLGYNVKYPSHWTTDLSLASSATGTSTLTFTEPVEDGKVPMRLALSVKPYEDKLNTKAQKKEFQDYGKVIKQNYSAFKATKPNNTLTFINRSSLSSTYRAKSGSQMMRGFFIMTNVAPHKQIVALHYSGPQGKYKNAKKFFTSVLYSVEPLNTPAATPAA